jgi:MFS family permease
VRLWSAQAISTFGARIARTGLPLAAVMTIRGTPFELGVLSVLTTAPDVLVGLFSGGFVDRGRKNRIMIGADIVRALVLLLVPALAWARLLNITELFLVAAVVGAASALFDIADHAYLPGLVGKAKLVEANARLTVTESISEIGGPALAGVLVQLLTAPFAIGINALSYFGSAAILGTIRRREDEVLQSRSREPWFRGLRVGFDAIFADRFIRPLFLMAILSPFFSGSFGALYSYFAINVLHLSPAVLGITIAVGGLGAIIGAGLSSFLCRAIGVGPTIALGYFTSAVSAFCVPLATAPLVYAVGMLMVAQVFGDSLAVAAIVPATSLRQHVMPRHVLGRTAALFRAGAGVSMVVGAILGGVLGEVLGPRTTLYLAVSGMVAVTALGLFSPLIRLKEMPVAPS